MKDYPRLIEHAFPLRQASLDSVHEKNVRHGHISTLHIWPARRPLAACRAALLATLLPDPGTPEGRKALCERIGGTVKEIVKKKGGKDVVAEETDGGILHWKRETENKGVLDELRDEIRQAYGGRAPKVLDPFAGGGAIPLEAMRLGCEVTASDINPVAWFILKCTLEYPQKLAGQKLPLPDFILADREFMESFLVKVHGIKKNSVALRQTLEGLGHGTTRGEVIQDEMNFDSAAGKAGISLEADLAWHVRAWGRKVLAEARKELAHVYPTYAAWQPLELGDPFEPEPMRLIEPNASGVADANTLNAEFSDEYLANKRNPRWVAKAAVAYLWARTVTCKNCRATLPLLKTRWLCKKDNRRVLLGMEPEPRKSGVRFRIVENVPARGGSAAQRREHDKKLGAGTMSKSGAKCPCCDTIVTTDEIRYEGRNGRLSSTLIAVAISGPERMEYRIPTPHDLEMSAVSGELVASTFSRVPFGVPHEAIPAGSSRQGGGSAFTVFLYGYDEWRKLFINRQLLTLGTLVRSTIDLRDDQKSYPQLWQEALAAYSACVLSRTVDYLASSCIWENGAEEVKHVFMRWALPITWDFAEANPFAPVERFFLGGLHSAGRVLDNLHQASWEGTVAPQVVKRSAIEDPVEKYDLIVTDPPYYDAIPYSDLMDFFYIWLRRALRGANEGLDFGFADEFSPKWDAEAKDGELVDDAFRNGGDRIVSKAAFEDGMSRAFIACRKSLAPNGRFVIVFAHKHPDAWETLVSAIIRAGFIVDGSWPIATEMSGGLRNLGRASLASSVWLVCKKREAAVKAGWDNRVIAEMRENIAEQLREFWDAGIRGPDFVWAATGPAMEAYSKYPAVKKANSPAGELLGVGEFLDSVRRMVIEYVVGRVLHVAPDATDRLDAVTSYYLLHRHDFGFEKAPAGACILYAVSCGLSDAELERTWNLIKVKGSSPSPGPEDDDDDEGESGADEGGGSEFTLRSWKERKEKRMGYEASGGREVPLIDRIHRLMHLWKDGDVRKVDDYIDGFALRRNELFLRVIQSLIELSDRSSDERPLLESLSNHLGARSANADMTMPLKLDTED
jgi:putative DNA methylase